jgi:sugar/nucleoside kinase (ribokinase family)
MALDETSPPSIKSEDRRPAAGASLVVVTHGIKGAGAWHRAAGPVQVEAPVIDVVDSVGAGESFQAALLFALHAVGRIRRKAVATAYLTIRPIGINCRQFRLVWSAHVRCSSH